MKAKIDEKVRRTYRVPEAARVAGSGERAIRDGIREGRIPHIKLSRNILIPREAFHRWLESGGETTGAR